MAGLGYEDVVFDSYSELAGDVYSGLYGDDIAWLECAFGDFGEEGVFVDLQSDAVSGTVAVDGQVTFCKGIACRRVDFFQAYAGAYPAYRRLLGGLDAVVDLLVKPGRSAEGKTPRRIAAITADLRPEVNQDGVIAPQLSCAGLMVISRAVGAEGHDRFKTRHGSELAHFKVQQAGGFAFGDTRP